MKPELLYYVDVGVGLEFLQPEPVLADSTWMGQALGRELCPNCRCVNRVAYPQPLNVTLAKPPEGQTAALVESTNVVIWRKDFIAEKMGCRRDFIFGKCSLAGGSCIEDYVTCYRRDYIIVRGGHTSKYRMCPECGTVISDVRTGAEYILERYIGNNDVFQDALCKLYMAADIAFPHDYKRWNDVTLTAINVRKEPADGKVLPGD